MIQKLPTEIKPDEWIEIIDKINEMIDCLNFWGDLYNSLEDTE